MSVHEYARRERQARCADVWSDYYSPRNCASLALSGATEVAGYREWQDLGRQVRKGEHGIALLAPVTVKDNETGETRVVNTRTVTVFDVTQTEALNV